MYSLPTSTTFAVFTIASAVSTAPTRPLVSISPRASNGMRVELQQSAEDASNVTTINAFRIRVAGRETRWSPSYRSPLTVCFSLHVVLSFRLEERTKVSAA
jgi:hypothetical protein